MDANKKSAFWGRQYADFSLFFNVFRWILGRNKWKRSTKKSLYTSFRTCSGILRQILTNC